MTRTKQATLQPMTESDWWDWKNDLTTALVARGYAEACSAAGDVEESCREAMDDRVVSKVLARVQPGERWLLDELRESGAWDETELADHEQNLIRMIWQLACDWKEFEDALESS